MTKASYYMMDHLKSKFPLTQELYPTMAIARGRVPFPQGCQAIAGFFHGQQPYQVYNHPYFLDPSADPNQVSPQMHLTEELQALFRLVRGMLFMNDITAKLDNTMTIVTDPATNRTVLYNPIDADEPTRVKVMSRLKNSSVSHIIVPSKQMWHGLPQWMAEFPDADVLCSGDPIEVHRGNNKVTSIKDDFVKINDSVELTRIKGDDIANEYVMWHEPSKSLSCTDLFHGGYADFDPVNSWMCRVWFKFMRDGNYKDVSILPKFKEVQVRNHGSLEEVQKTIDLITRKYDLQLLVFAHGTPPLDPQGGHPKDVLRMQWGMEPIVQVQKGHHHHTHPE